MFQNAISTPVRAEAIKIARGIGGDTVLVELGSKYFHCPTPPEDVLNLTVNDIPHSQPTAVLMYVGRQTRQLSYPEEAMAALKVNEIVMLADVFLQAFMSAVAGLEEVVGNNTTEQHVKICQVLKEKRFVAFLSEIYGRKARTDYSWYTTDGKLSIADLQEIVVIQTMRNVFPKGIPSGWLPDEHPLLATTQPQTFRNEKVNLHYARQAGLIQETEQDDT